MSERRRTPAWCKDQIYRYWVLQREGEYLTEEELTEEEHKRLERSKKWHPSQAPAPKDGRKA